MKGDKKRKNTTFQAKNVPWNKGKCINMHTLPEPVKLYQCPRLSYDDYMDLIHTCSGDYGEYRCLLDVDEEPVNSIILRPAPPKPQLVDSYLKSEDTESDLQTYRLLHLEKTAILFNQSVQEHKRASQSCNGDLTWDVSSQRKYGMCWQMRVICKKCNYKGELTKLYEEVETGKRGRKPAAPNLGVQVGLSHTMISNTAFRNILLAANVPAPATSGMQKQTNKVSDKIVTFNQADMSTQRQNLTLINELKGLPADSPHHIQGDGRYNNRLASGVGKTPYQPASQAVYTVIENTTKQKKIVAVNIRNKLCPVGDRLRATNPGLVCPHHEGPCAANLSKTATIANEAEMAEACVRDLNKDGVTVKYFTSDCDSKAAIGVKKAQSHLNVNVESLKDTRHSSAAQQRKLKELNLSKNCFPGRTKALREKQQTRFSLELATRINAEFNACHKLYGSDVTVLKQKLKYLPGALVSCYQGDCIHCRKYSFVCGRHRWSKPYMPKGVIINPSDKDSSEIIKCINMRLGTTAIERTKFNSNSQKAESTNRAYSRCNPKIVTMARNMPGRIHSAVNLLNDGVANSTIKKCNAVGSKITKGSTVAKQLKSEQDQVKYRRKYNASLKYKTKRAVARKLRYQAYDETHNLQSYQKDIMEDHSYSSKEMSVVTQNQQILHDHDYN